MSDKTNFRTEMLPPYLRPTFPRKLVEEGFIYTYQSEKLETGIHQVPLNLPITAKIHSFTFPPDVIKWFRVRQVTIANSLYLISNLTMWIRLDRLPQCPPTRIIESSNNIQFTVKNIGKLPRTFRIHIGCSVVRDE